MEIFGCMCVESTCDASAKNVFAIVERCREDGESI